MFRISARDNGLYFFRERADVRRCSGCNALTNKWSENLASVAIPKDLREDVSYSYDGVLVVTLRFKQWIEGAATSTVLFQPLQRNLFAARPRTAVAFDAERRGTRFENRCDACGHDESVVGAIPVFLKPGMTVRAKDIVRTDLEFGSGDEKTPLVLCGDDLAHAIERMRLRGLELVPVQQG